MTDRKTILYCGAGLSSAAYCLVVLLSARMLTWRKSALNWVWLITAGLYLANSITYILTNILTDPKTPLFRDHILMFVKNYLTLASAAFLLTGAYASITDRFVTNIKSSILFSSLISLPLPIGVLLSAYFDKFHYFFFFSTLFDVELFMITISSVCMYGYDVLVIRQKSGKDLDKSTLLLIFAVYLFSYWIAAMIIKQNLAVAYKKDDSVLISLYNNRSFYISIVRHFAVFIFSLLHFVCIKENRYFIGRQRYVEANVQD